MTYEKCILCKRKLATSTELKRGTCDDGENCDARIFRSAAGPRLAGVNQVDLYRGAPKLGDAA